MHIRSLPDMMSYPYFFSTGGVTPAVPSNIHIQPQVVPNIAAPSSGIIYLNTVAPGAQPNTTGQNVGLLAVVPPVGLIDLTDKDAQMHMFSAVWKMTPSRVIMRHLIEVLIKKFEDLVTFIRTHVLPYLPGTRSLCTEPVSAAPVCPSCKQSSRPWFMNPPELVVVGTFIRSSIIVYLTVLREAANCALSML